MNKARILGLLRHLLTFAGGYAVAKGWADENTVSEIAGALVTIAGAVWSAAAPEKSEA